MDKSKIKKDKKNKPPHFKHIRNKHDDVIVEQTIDGYGDGVSPDTNNGPEVSPDVRDDEPTV